MKIELYKKVFNQYFNDKKFFKDFQDSIQIIQKSKRIFFIGNGGSNAISSHMAEDYMKIGKKPTFSFSDGALITCFSNDYGYENAMKEWVSNHFQEGDLLVAISSSGESKNIINATRYFNSLGGQSITLTGFIENNSLSSHGLINFYINSDSYGIVECFHEIILHSLLDELSSN